MMLWSLPADGSCQSLMYVEAEIWLSFIEPDAKPSGDTQPGKSKKDMSKLSKTIVAGILQV